MKKTNKIKIDETAFIESPVEIIVKAFDECVISLTPNNLKLYLEDWQLNYLIEYCIDYKLVNKMSLDVAQELFKKQQRRKGTYWDKEQNRVVAIHINAVADYPDRYCHIRRWRKQQENEQKRTT